MYKHSYVNIAITFSLNAGPRVGKAPAGMDDLEPS